jgi:hypothetical protein
MKRSCHHVGTKPRDVDMARVENSNGIGIIAKRRQYMLQRHLTRSSRSRKLGAAR